VCVRQMSRLRTQSDRSEETVEQKRKTDLVEANKGSPALLRCGPREQSRTRSPPPSSTGDETETLETNNGGKEIQEERKGGNDANEH
jgi:hypothetical protein